LCHRGPLAKHYYGDEIKERDRERERSGQCVWRIWGEEKQVQLLVGENAGNGSEDINFEGLY